MKIFSSTLPWRPAGPSINLTLKSNKDEDREGRLTKAVRAGALVRYQVNLERGEHEVRRLWLRPNVRAALSIQNLGEDQLARVHAAFRRFVLGGLFNVVSKECDAPGTLNLADIRELKSEPPPFVEMRFKPPKHHLRLFGRFICKDGLILTSSAMKSEKGAATIKSLSVQEERKRCDDVFNSLGFDITGFPSDIGRSITNAKII
jgi:hypothetical protein